MYHTGSYKAREHTEAMKSETPGVYYVLDNLGGFFGGAAWILWGHDESRMGMCGRAEPPLQVQHLQCVPCCCTWEKQSN